MQHMHNNIVLNSTRVFITSPSSLVPLKVLVSPQEKIIRWNECFFVSGDDASAAFVPVSPLNAIIWLTPVK